MLTFDLNEIGICITAFTLLRSYLSDHCQKVNIRDGMSDRFPLQIWRATKVPLWPGVIWNLCKQLIFSF